MTVTLSQRIAEYAAAEVEAGRSATPDDAVNQYMEAQLREEERFFDELEGELLVAVRAPQIPYSEGAFSALAEQIIAERQSA